jgi:multiple sugar transport system permease protein
MKILTSKGSINRQELIHRLILLFTISLIIAWSIGPIYWIVITGLKNTEEVYMSPPTLFPRDLTLKNFVTIFTERPFAFYLRNSVIVASTTVIISTFCAILAGYAFAKMNIKGKSIWLLVIILTRAVPPASLLVPFYVMGKSFNLINTLFILMLGYIYLTLPLNIWIITSFFEQFPDELIDAAEIDGCTRTSALFRVVMPSLLPALTAVGIITFMLSWNELLYGVVFTNTKAAKTLSPGLTDFFGDFHIFWNQLASASIIAVLPAVVFTVFFSRYLISGLIRGAIKG